MNRLLLVALFLLCCAVAGKTQIPVPEGYGCTVRGFCRDSIFFSSGKLPKKAGSVTAIQQFLERHLNGTFQITRDNLVVGSGYNRLEGCYWVAAAALHGDRFIVSLSPRNSAGFRAAGSWLVEQARDAAAYSRRWEFVDAAGRHCSEGLLTR